MSDPDLSHVVNAGAVPFTNGRFLRDAIDAAAPATLEGGELVLSAQDLTGDGWSRQGSSAEFSRGVYRVRYVPGPAEAGGYFSSFYAWRSDAGQAWSPDASKGEAVAVTGSTPVRPPFSVAAGVVVVLALLWLNR